MKNQQVGVRELRQNLSLYLRRVKLESTSRSRTTTCPSLSWRLCQAGIRRWRG